MSGIEPLESDCNAAESEAGATEEIDSSLVDAAASSEEGAPVQAGPSQSEMPFAIVYGKAWTDVPKDLYIPPDALEIILEAFEGPFDLLLYLIRRQNIDILEIDVSEITNQYVSYVEMMDAMQFELAAEYLVMAAMLAEIKSRMLLPRSEESEEEDEDDPRATLIRRLQEYERFKQAAEDIDTLPRQYRDFHVAQAKAPDKNITRPAPEVDLKELLLALSEVLRRADMFESHHIQKERLSTRERMTKVLDALREKQFMPFVSLFNVSEGRLGVVVTFLAVLELIKESLVEIVQTDDFGPIHVKSRQSSITEESIHNEFDNDSERAVYEDESVAMSEGTREALKEEVQTTLDGDGRAEGDPESESPEGQSFQDDLSRKEDSDTGAQLILGEREGSPAEDSLDDDGLDKQP